MLKWYVTHRGPAVSVGNPEVGTGFPVELGTGSGDKGTGRVTAGRQENCQWPPPHGSERGTEAQGGAHAPGPCRASRMARRMAAAATAPGSGWSSRAELM